MTNKTIKNQDSLYKEQLENVYLEYSILRRKLQSKVEALTIMNKELNECRLERDQYKLIAEQGQSRYSLKKLSSQYNIGTFSGTLDYDRNFATSVKMLNDLREENKSLTVEIGRLKQKLSDRDGDVRLLRQRLQSQKETESTSKTSTSFTNHDREDLIKQLEILNEKVKDLKSDLRSIIDEKEELISERDAYKCKIHRQNHELKIFMCGDKEIIEDLDMDSLIMENKYLADRVAQVETEKELVNQTLQNYKSMLENKRKKSNIKLEIADNETIMTQEQVAHLFENKLNLDSAITSAKLLEIKNFVYGVIEALNDRTLALAHQRKANKILATRISDLELKLNPSKNNGTKKKSTPSQIFLQNYNPANVDSNFDAMLDEELKKYDKSEKSMPKHENGDPECNGSQNLNGFAKNGDDDLELPPHLDALLKKALDDIKQDKEKDNKDD